ncbi:Malic enzyme, NAD-binding domain protein, partial [mine drainage metagenome]
LGKPVLHDDQHGTAVVALAALINAARRARRSLPESTVGQLGLGAAGTGIVRLLRAYGVNRVLGADRNPQALARIKTLGGRRSDPGVDHAAGRHRGRDHGRQGPSSDPSGSGRGR